jgi:hypothetical protein
MEGDMPFEAASVSSLSVLQILFRLKETLRVEIDTSAFDQLLCRREVLGCVDKRDSHEGSSVIQAGICYGDQLAPRPDERRGMVAV